MSISKSDIEWLTLIRDRASTEGIILTGGNAEAFARALSAAIPVLERARWRRLGEENPDDGYVLVFREYWNSPQCLFLANDHWNDDRESIDAKVNDLWTPLPKPPVNP